MDQHSRKIKIAYSLMACVLIAILFVCAFGQQAENPEQYISVPRQAKIQPDYTDITLPPNIAPLNFIVKEQADRYRVIISSTQGRPINITAKSPKIIIPEKSWRNLLEKNRSEKLYIEIFTRNNDGKWSKFERITNTIANEAIDNYLAYRRIHPAHTMWRKMGIYQRNLGNFDESVILDNDYFQSGCVNCHTFCNNKTEKMFVHIRSGKFGSSAILVEDGKPQKIGTKFGYTAWHPSGRLATYSVNHVIQFFHSSQSEVRDVLDLDSLIAYYSLDQKKTKTVPQLSKKDRLETYPTWSPDGRYLYFCSAPLTWSDHTVVPDQYNSIKYDLQRISYDLNTDKWGELETVLTAEQTDSSIMLPRISPDGRWLLLCLCDYGCFPVYRDSSDLYMIDLEAAKNTGRYEPVRLEANSSQSESWHSWSSNNRWIAFSSKRNSGVFTRTYFSYVDQSGKTYKPFVLPQKDPAYYDSCLWTFSIPELITEPVRAVKEQLGKIVRSPVKIPANLPVTAATPKAGSPAIHQEPWLGQRE